MTQEVYLMKKNTITVLLIFCLMAALLPAYADPADTIPVGQIIELFDGDVYDLDGDSIPEKISFETYMVDYESMFTLTIGSITLDGKGDDLTGRLHAVKMSPYTDDCLILISDYGMSSDDTTYFYSYMDGDLSPAGTIATMPWDLTVTGQNTFTGIVRSFYLQTWSRPCDYVITNKGFFDEDDRYFSRSVSVNEVPRSVYAMGTLVTVTRDIDLQVSITNPAVCSGIKAGEQAILAASDDIEWLYIERVESDWNYDAQGGWFRTDIGGWSCIVNGEKVETGELFEGLFYAD